MSNKRSYVKNELQVGLKFNDLVKALKHLSPKARQDFIEDLQAATSTAYVHSIREARAEYRAGKIVAHNKVFKSRRSYKRRTKNT